MPATRSAKQRPHQTYPQDDRLIRTLTRLLDDAFTIPGTNYRIGLDPILGLVLPGGGDIASTMTSGLIILRAVQRGAPKVLVLRMLANLGIDTVLGSIPLLGDLFDFVFKANRRNLDLLQARQGLRIRKATLGDYLFLAAVMLIFLAIVSIPVVLIVLLIGKLLQ